MMLAFIAGLIIIDQVVKIVVVNVLHFQYVENPGIFFGIGAGLLYNFRWVFVLFGIIALGFLFRIAKKTKVLTDYSADRTLFYALSLMIAGVVSNIVDRFLYNGNIIDFISLEIGSFATMIFNLADVMIVTGFVLLVFWSLRRFRNS